MGRQNSKWLLATNQDALGQRRTVSGSCPQMAHFFAGICPCTRSKTFLSSIVWFQVCPRFSYQKGQLVSQHFLPLLSFSEADLMLNSWESFNLFSLLSLSSKTSSLCWSSEWAEGENKWNNPCFCSWWFSGVCDHLSTPFRGPEQDPGLGSVWGPQRMQDYSRHFSYARCELVLFYRIPHYFY